MNKLFQKQYFQILTVIWQKKRLKPQKQYKMTHAGLNEKHVKRFEHISVANRSKVIKVKQRKSKVKFLNICHTYILNIYISLI